MTHRRETRRILSWGLAVGLALGGCATPDPTPPIPETTAGGPAPESASFVPGRTPGGQVTTPRPTGVTSDAGSRYLSHGVTGALTVETVPERTPGDAAAIAQPVDEPPRADEPAAAGDDLGLPPTGRLPGTEPAEAGDR